MGRRGDAIVDLGFDVQAFLDGVRNPFDFPIIRDSLYQKSYDSIDRGFPKESSDYLVNGRMLEQTKYIMKNEIRLLENL